MGYIKVCWPESQALMELSEEDMDDYGIELGNDCSYFVPEEDYDEIYELAEKRAKQNEDGFVSSVVVDTIHVLDDGEEYSFNEDYETQNYTIVGFYVDDGNEDVRVVTFDHVGNRDDLFLSTMPESIAKEVAWRIYNEEYYQQEIERARDFPWDYFKKSE